ncbi:MAG: alkaline phosphatase family protein [Gemmatimonadales bacterium]
MRPFPLLLLTTLTTGCIRPAVHGLPLGADERLVLLIALDGFHSNDLERPGVVRLRKLAAQGVRGEALIPVFPTKTFPNLFTLATGLYPEHHGIVGSVMIDARLGRFTAADTAVNRKPEWWSAAEPIWITAERQGRRAATMFWVGSEIAYRGRRPSYWRDFDLRVTERQRVQQVLTWLDLPTSERPVLITLYLNGVDVAGHRYGPDHPAVDSAAAALDAAIGVLLDGLAERGLTGRTDLVVVSDHGMTAISPDRVIYLDDYVALAPSEIVDLEPVTTLDPAPGRRKAVYQALQRAHPHLTVYRREDMPQRFRFRNHPRISPLIAMADPGWTIGTRERWKTRPVTNRGNHGYDNLLPSMAGIFIGVGPSFREGAVVPSFQSVHIYELMARLLAVHPARNDGHRDSVAAVLR